MSGSRRTRKQNSAVKNVAPSRVDWTLLLLAGIMLLGLAVRLLPALNTIVGGQVIFNGPDSSYHMRRIVYTVLHYPFPNLFDSYVSYPDGYVIGWPPVFDFLAATAALILGLGSPGAFTIEMASSLLPVLIGVLTIPVVYYLVRGLLNEKAGLIAALLFAIIPAGVFRSMFGVVDHHGLEVLVSMAMYLLFIRSVTSAKKSDMRVSSLSLTGPVAYAILAGIASACMVLSWDGAAIFIGVIVAYAFVQYVYDVRNGEDSGYLTVPGAIASATGLAVILVVDALGAAGFPLITASMAWFETIFLAGVLIFFIVMAFLSSLFQKRRLPWYGLPVATAVLAVAAVAVVWVVHPGFIYAARSGLIYLAGIDEVMGTVTETEMLFMSGGRLSFAVPWAYFSFIGPLSVLGLLLYLYTARVKTLKQGEVFLLVWTAAVLVLGIMQKRFLNILAVSVSTFGAYAIYRSLQLAGLEEYLHPSKSKKPSAARSGSISTALTLVSCIVALLLLPSLISTIAMALTPEYYAQDWNSACQWVSDNTPKTSFLYSADNGTHPEYGIMSWWDYGNYILYRAERPAVANNFQTGVNESARFFTAHDESAADAIVDNRSARYVMLDYRMGSPYAGVQYGIFEDMALLAGENASGYHDRALYANRSANEKYYDSMYSRLFNADGCGAGYGSITIEPLEHYRLIYETHGDDPVKVFEYVKGAVVTGKAAPGSEVGIRLNLSTPYDVRNYVNSTLAGPDGRYAFVVPYATSSGGFVATGSAYIVTSGVTSASVIVPESAVLSGETVPA